MQVKEIDIDTGKIKGYGICKKKYKISFLGGPTTPNYSIYYCFQLFVVRKLLAKSKVVRMASNIC